MNKMFIGLLLLLGFIIYINKNNKKEYFNDKIYPDNSLINHDYSSIDHEDSSMKNNLLIDHENSLLKDKMENVKYEDEPTYVDKRFLLEQEIGIDLASYHSNKWINHIDENGEPVYFTTEQITGTPSIIVENKIKPTWEFNKPKISNVDGYIEPIDGKTIREVYDNSILDFKKLIPKKEMIENNNHSKGASSLSYYTPDKWTYNNEKLENGGSNNGLFANDPATLGSVSIF